MNKQDKKWLSSKISALESIAYTLLHINPNVNYNSESWYLKNLTNEIKKRCKE